ncbi:MAG: hypothetical protein WCI73_10395 [Phycisphaerae bacterium]
MIADTRPVLPSPDPHSILETDNPASGLHFAVAETLEDVTDSWHLLYSVYRRVGYIPPNPYELHTTPHAISPEALVVTAKIQGLTVGTISAIPDGPLGLPLDSVYHTQLQALREPGRRLVEIGLFADRREDVDRSFITILELMRFTFYFGYHQATTDCVCGIPPRRARLYARAFGFDIIGEPTTYASVQGNPVVLLHFNRTHLLNNLNQYKAMDYFTQHPLARDVFESRFRFQPEQLADSLLQKYLRTLEAAKHDQAHVVN